jgi:polygalacturonase
VVYCEKVDMNNVTIRNAIEGVRAPSSDGIDVDSCRDVLVRNCDIDCDDDCIVIKSGRDGDGFCRNAPSENIVVRNCIARRGHGMVAIGTEIAGSVRNVYVANCQAEGTLSGVRFKSKIGRGGVVENIVYENINMKNVHWAIRMRLTDTRSNFPQLVDPKIPVLGGEIAIPRFRNVLLRNITAVDSTSCFSFHVAQIAPPPVENMTFENVELHGAEDIGNSEQARWKNWNTKSLRVNGKRLFGDGETGAPAGLYEAVLKATAHVGPLDGDVAK